MAAIQGTGISKKIIGFLKTLHIVSLLASGSVVYAQEDQFNLGFLFNVNMHSSVGENNEFWNSGERSWPSISTSEGIFVNRNLSKHTYGNIEFRYIQKGSNNTINNANQGLKTLCVTLWFSVHLCEIFLLITQSITEEAQRSTEKLLCN